MDWLIDKKEFRTSLNPMLNCSFIQKSVDARRLVGAAVLVLVFFLPLHIHAADEAHQLTHECSCVHGTRTQLASIVSSTILTIVPAVFFVITKLPEALISLAVESDFARAPPVSL
jgi:hypothetical protein